VRRHSGKLLMLAVALNRPDLAELLIAHGADVEKVDLLGRLDDAERPVADLLFAHGKKAPSWMLPRACRPDVSSNELHRVQVLLEYGANLEDRDRHGHTALHYAVRSGQLPLIILLLERGADPNAPDAKGLTPLLHLAKTRSRLDPLAVLELLVAHGAQVDARDEQEGTLLMHCARQSQVAAVRWLLAHGADHSLRNRHGKRALDLARPHPELLWLLSEEQ
jgi:ankyrin repeat protein